MNDPNRRPPLFTYAALALALLAGAAALYFWNQDRELEAQIAALESSVPRETREAIRPPVLRLGMTLPDFTSPVAIGTEAAFSFAVASPVETHPGVLRFRPIAWWSCFV